MKALLFILFGSILLSTYSLNLSQRLERERQRAWNEKALVYMNMLQYQDRCYAHESIDVPHKKGEKPNKVISEMGYDKKLKTTYYKGWCIDAYIHAMEYLRLKDNYIKKYGKDDFNEEHFQETHPPSHGSVLRPQI